MDLLTRPRKSLLCTEPLEGRRLLAAPGLPHVVDGGGVETVEFDFAEESDEGDVALSPSDVPGAVLAAFRMRFPGAEVLEAEYSEEDGAPEYDLTARFEGDQIDATFTPRGRLLETEHAVTSDDLPAEVLDWLRRNFRGAEIEEASTVTDDGGDLTYEVGFTAPGQGELEATLRVEPSRPAPESQAAVPPPTTDPVTEFPAPPADASGAWLEEQSGGEPGPAKASAAESPSADAAEPVVAAAPSAAQPLGRSPSRNIPFSTPFALSFRAIMPTRAPAPDWLPELIELFAGGIPADADAVEQAVAAILSRIEAAAGGDAPEQEPRYACALRFLLVAALVGGAQLLLLESRRANAGPVNHFNAATSSWSWLLGAPPSDGP